ncbi:hypothetical protein Cch01nite_04830 [Cellulomonas chitinilytica]|uniref:Uncharacterized protein n=1 Tax=Cellulomonas chitinilytica TaxID=398759 RepID=A0A919P1I4_9CELL|nr:hypothetical protein [Cellulomonas chitinilytica]GIG19759.1 hypothetical protein Cch01nite_04830 [Cellulomonas chitinilytica]
MKPPPAGLPPANSRKWHSRRWWDQLGYLRVRSLGNPEWQRNTPWLLGVLTRQRDAGHPGERELYDAAIAATRRYPRTTAGATDAGAAWDEVLTAIDDLLVVRQARHLEKVRAAQAQQRARGDNEVHGART